MIPGFAVGQIKGGDGKTTLAVLFGLYQALQRQARVLFVDMDPQATLSYLLLQRRLVEAIPWFDGGHAVRVAEGREVWLLPTNPTQALKDVTGKIRGRAVIERLEQATAEIQPDVVVIDTPGANALWARFGFEATGKVIIPTTLSVQDAVSTATTAQLLKLLRSQGVAVEAWYIPWGLPRTKAKWLQRKLEKAQQQFGEHLLPAVPQHMTLKRWVPLDDLRAGKLLRLPEAYHEAFRAIERHVLERSDA